MNYKFFYHFGGSILLVALSFNTKVGPNLSKKIKIKKSRTSVEKNGGCFSVNEPFDLLEIAHVAGHSERPSVGVSQLPFRLFLGEKLCNEWMTQIQYRNHKPLPLFSHVNRHAPPRNHLPATGDRPSVAASRPEEASNHLRPSQAERK